MKWLINKFLSAGDKAIFNNDLARRTASDKILRDKAFKLLKMQNMLGIKEVLLQWFINFLIE